MGRRPMYLRFAFIDSSILKAGTCSIKSLPVAFRPVTGNVLGVNGHQHDCTTSAGQPTTKSTHSRRANNRRRTKISVVFGVARGLHNSLYGRCDTRLPPCRRCSNQGKDRHFLWIAGTLREHPVCSRFRLVAIAKPSTTTPNLQLEFGIFNGGDCFSSSPLPLSLSVE